MTENESKTLEILRDRRNWRPPTLRFMVKEVGLCDNNSILGILKRLIKKGFVEKIGVNYYPKKWENLFKIDSTGEKS